MEFRMLERNTPVAGERIVEELWNGRAPPTASKVVQNLVSQLRRSLAGEDVLRTRGHAYELVVPDEALALWRGPALGELADERGPGPRPAASRSAAWWRSSGSSMRTSRSDITPT